MLFCNSAFIRVRSGDEAMACHFTESHKNATYQSKTTQNELITIIGEQILHTIVNRSFANGGFFSVIADEVQDCSNSEQLALVIRYCMGPEGITEVQKI